MLLALLPWIVIRSWRYNAIMSSYRGVRFNYVCRTGRAYWALLFCPLLLIIGLYVGLIVLLGIGSGLGNQRHCFYAGADADFGRCRHLRR